MTNWDWLDANYFTLDTFNNYVWSNKGFLYLTPIIPVLFLLKWLLFLKSRQKLKLVLPTSKNKISWIVLLRFIPPIIFLIFIELVLISIARPQRIIEKVLKTEIGIDIVLAIDISESMAGLDLSPNRLEAAKKVAWEFIKERKNDRIGLVVFSGEAFALCPLTTDYPLLKNTIDNIQIGMIDNDGTAIGSALACATNRLRDSKSKSKIIILISDGENNAGQLDPYTAVDLAKVFGIRTHTIAIGKIGKVNYLSESGETYEVENQIDEKMLSEIGIIGGGSFGNAKTNGTLSEIFKKIDQLEKSTTKTDKLIDIYDFYDVYLYWALLFAIIWLFTKSTFLSNVLVD